MDNKTPDEEKNPTEAELDIKSELAKVTIHPKMIATVVMGGILLAIIVIYNLFFNGPSTSQAEIIKKGKSDVNNEINKPAAKAADELIVPMLPEAPKLKEPIAPPLPTALPKVEKTLEKPIPIVKEIEEPQPVISKPTTAILPNATMDKETKAKYEARRKSSVMLLSNVPKKTAEEVEQLTDFKKRDELEYTLGKGKVIHAIIESAVNTDLSEEVRAIIARDVYSESNKVILIPKGSRIFGTYGNSIDTTYGRVVIDWQRIDLLSGYTVNFSGVAVDQLGRRGVQGRLDKKYAEKISNSILSTALNTAFASAIDKVVRPVAQSSTVALQSQVTAMQTNISSAYSDPNFTSNPQQQIINMCNAAKAAITDNTSAIYQTVITTCATALTSATGVNPAVATSLYNSLMNAGTSSLTSAASNVSPSKAQQATQEGFENFSKTVVDMLDNKDLKDTITIDQGTEVKIYVKKDYKFPKAAIKRARLVK